MTTNTRSPLESNSPWLEVYLRAYAQHVSSPIAVARKKLKVIYLPHCHTILCGRRGKNHDLDYIE